MITKATITNFRSFGVTAGSKPHEIEFTPLTVIVGDNSSGKSNLLRALRFATSPDLGQLCREDFFIRTAKGGPRKTGEFSVRLECTHNGASTIIECHAWGTDSKGYTKQFTINGVDYSEITSMSPPTAELRGALEPHEVFVAPTVRDVTYMNSATELLPLATRSTIAGTSKQLRKELTKKLATVCKQLQGSLGVSVVTVLPVLSLEALMQVVKLAFQVNDGIDLPLQNLGQGHISKAILKLAEIQGQSRTICVEEPEIHVHPTGIKSLIATFKKITQTGSRQIIITTHSADVVNHADFDHMLSVRKEGQRTVVQAIKPSLVGFSHTDINHLQHAILRRHQRGSLFLSKLVLLVEGPYDRLILDALDRDGRIDLLDRDVAVIDMGSKSEFPKYHKLLLEIGRPYAVLLDDDSVAAPPAMGPGGIVAPGTPSTPGEAMRALLDTGVIPVASWGNAECNVYRNSSSSRRRGIMRALSEKITRPIALIAHGHHDVGGIVKECWGKASVVEQTGLYTLLGGTNPAPTAQELEASTDRAVRKKQLDMVKVVAGLPVNRFEVLCRQITAALDELV